MLTLDGDGQNAKTLTGTPGQTLQVPFTGLSRGNHDYTVVVSFDRDGGKAESEVMQGSFIVGLPSSFCYEMPLEMTFNAEMADDLVIVNANGDSKTLYMGSEGLSYDYDGNMAADDWAFTAPVEIADISHLINATINVKGRSSSYHELFELWIGTAASPEAMTRKLLDVDVAWNEWTPRTPISCSQRPDGMWWAYM